MGNSFRPFIQQIYKIYLKLLSTIKQTKNTTSHKAYTNIYKLHEKQNLKKYYITSCTSVKKL